MSTRTLTPAEQAEAESHGLSPNDISQQLRFFASPPPAVRLIRPCTLGDGIRALAGREVERLAAGYEVALGARRAVSFVPASGAASRMFKVPSAFANSEEPVSISRLAAQKARSKDARELLELLEGMEKFAFFPAWKSAARRAGVVLDRSDGDADVRPGLRVLLDTPGLDYASLPKGLLAFHRYTDGPRTPFEEHLVEAAQYARDSHGTCRLHFTVSDDHLELFRALAGESLDVYGAKLGVRYEVEFSTQHASTDSLAVDLDGAPFHVAGGALLFRPGGHGALLENLGAIDADVVFLKNIDNVVPDHLKAEVVSWRRALGTLMIETQSRMFDAIAAIDAARDGAMSGARALLAELGTVVAADSDAESIRTLLDRPLRVCGMVANTGEPGGGPFWVKLDERDTIQVVEASQVDSSDASQQAILATATHFNPVDLVCSLRDHQGRPHDLRRFVDEEAVFLVEKSKDGRPCRSIERPGLWNGAMARWNTVFVEVPLATFNPVKTVNALLAPAHQPPC